MEGRAPRKPNWTLQAILCAGVVAWQGYDLATAVEARSTALVALQWVCCSPAGWSAASGRWSCWRGALSRAVEGGGPSALGLIRQSFLFKASPDPFPARRP